MIEQIYFSEYEDIPMTIKPTTMQEVLDLYGDIKNEPVVADRDILKCIEDLKNIRHVITVLQSQEDELKDMIACHMLDKAQLITEDGEVIVTWAKASSSSRFNEKLFKIEHSDLYEKFLEEREGSRRFIVK